MIIDNDIFWNNFNFHQGNPPFTGAHTRAPPRWRRSAPASCCSAAAATGSRTTASTATTSTGVAAVEGILVTKTPAARTLARNVVQNNQFGLNGTDVNGFDVMLRRQRHQQLLRDGRRDLDVPGRRLDLRGLRRRPTPSASPRRTR